MFSRALELPRPHQLSLNQLPANILALRTLLDSVLDSTLSLIYLISDSF